MLSFAHKINFSKKHAIVVLKFTDETGKDFYHIIRTDLKGYELMQKDFAEKAEREVSEYGEVIVSGWGEPPEDLINELKEEE